MQAWVFNSITQEIYNFFDCVYQVKGVFLDIQEAFENVWDEGVMFELEQNGFYDKRKERVVLNKRVFSWTNLKAVVPQGSILGPLLCRIYITIY